ncbi:hypothetical protein A0H81_05771 [Grifola frondosa]|uniref:Uncharacterized protein n=1 Tax=Grifola frondosa TaxID=5627 RepID=A0A1C7MCU0_GRIFR|nr:hypothetical protein A0H81_05771 [Grifola frondosa]
MGVSNFTPAEVTWLQEQYATQEVCELLKAEAHGCLKAIATLLTTRYTADFRDCLPAETDAEFAKRRANKTLAERDELVQKHAETTDARAERLMKAATRIYNWVKVHSKNRKTHAEVTKIAPIPTGRSPRKKSAWDVYRAEHPDVTEVPVVTADDGKRRGDLTAFTKMAQLQAEEANKTTDEVGDTALTVEARRAAKAGQLPDYIRATIDHWQVETGWVSFCFAGGIDDVGELSACAEWTGRDAQGEDLKTSSTAKTVVEEAPQPLTNEVVSIGRGDSQDRAIEAAEPSQDQHADPLDKEVMRGSVDARATEEAVDLPAPTAPDSVGGAETTVASVPERAHPGMTKKGTKVAAERAPPGLTKKGKKVVAAARARAGSAPRPKQDTSGRQIGASRQCVMSITERKAAQADSGCKNDLKQASKSRRVAIEPANKKRAKKA